MRLLPKTAAGACGILLAFSFAACQKAGPPPAPAASATPAASVTPPPAVTLSPMGTPGSSEPPEVSATPEPTPIPEVSPAPAVLNTDPDTYTYLISRDYPLSGDYAPADLTVPDVLFSFSDTNLDKAKLRKEAAGALEELFNAAFTEAGHTLYGISAYRSYDRQYTIYATNLILYGVRHTNLYSAAPGMSEHQTGLTIDVSCAAAGMALEDYFADTKEGKWLAENAYRFGYIIRYPKGKEAITGYSYEPWHIRYVGIPLAYYLYQNDMTLDEYYGYTPTHTLAELTDTPLIDTASPAYLALYKSYFPPTPIPTPVPVLDLAGNPVLNENGEPYWKDAVLGEDGEPLLSEEGTFYYKEAIFSADGTLLLNPDGLPYFKEPFFLEDGTLALDENGLPVFLEPVFAEDGALLLDEEARPVFAPLSSEEEPAPEPTDVPESEEPSPEPTEIPESEGPSPEPTDVPQGEEPSPEPSDVPESEEPSPEPTDVPESEESSPEPTEIPESEGSAPEPSDVPEE